MQLELRHLRLVHAVTEERSLTAAASRLHLTQSALSHQLREIEDRLGTPLFFRVKKRLVLTGAGERVLATARTVIPEVEEAERAIARLKTGDEGVLRLTTQCYTTYHWLPDLLAQYRKRFPRVDVQILLECTRRPVEALLRGEIDLAIFTQPPGERALLAYPLFKDEIVAVVAPGHRLASRKFLQPSDFADEHVLLHTPPEENFFYQQVLRAAGVTPREISQLQLTEGIISMAQAGLGVAALADWAVAPAVKAGKLKSIRITRRGHRRQWTAAVLRRGAVPSYVEAFIAALAEKGPAASRVRLG